MAHPVSRMISAQRGAVVTLTCVVLTAPAGTRAGTGAPDFQQWTELDAVIGLQHRASMTVIGQARFSETLANPVFTGSGLDFSYQYESWSFGIGYRHQITGYHTDEPEVTQLALLVTTYAQRFGRGTLNVRLRMENTISAFSNPWRVRLRGEYRWATPGWDPLTYLFANDEVYYRFQDDMLYRNRFQAGVGLALTRRSNIRVYYQRQDDKLNTPGALNVIGAIVVMSFE